MSQIPSAASVRHRRSRDRYARCPVCSKTDVDGLHVDRCEERERYRKEAAKRAAELDVTEVAANDLWAHVNSRHGPLVAAQLTILALDLGWRPTVGTGLPPVAPPTPAADNPAVRAGAGEES